MTFRFRACMLLVAIGAVMSGCTSDPTRLMDEQVRSGDRPECQTQISRGIGSSASGVETAADPCGNLGTVPIISSDAAKP